jgi:hypothetical protein
MDSGVITLVPASMSLADSQITLSGGSTVEGRLRMKIGVSSAALTSAVPAFTVDKPLEIPLTGTVEAPKFDLEQAIRQLPETTARPIQEWISQQTIALRALESEDAQRDKEKKLREMLKGFAPEGAGKP